MTTATARKKVAILGSGCGGLSAAFWLSATPALRQRYEVTVYTEGWQLGGKAASGRNAAQGSRIEEHGLHLMLGFYNTVFYTMRACYEHMDMPDNSAFPDWQSAFTAQRSVTLWGHVPDKSGTADWRPWTLPFPDLPGQPGSERPTTALDPAYMNNAVHRLLERLADEVRKLADRHLKHHNILDKILARALEKMVDDLLGPVTRGVDFLETEAREAFLKLLRDLQQWFHHHLGPALKKHANSDTELGFICYCSYILIDLAFAGLIGFLSEVVPYGEAGYARINDKDFKDWLVAQGASKETSESPPVMCLYDLAFAYPGGNSSKAANGQAAAGAMLHLAMRMAFTYKDAPIWRMNAGMGDIIFTPLYTLLKNHGVAFEFFHRVTDLRLSADGKNIATIDMQQQAGIKTAPYEPLRQLTFRDGKRWNCWPSEPDWTQLVDGEKLKAAGTDFKDPWCHSHIGCKTLSQGGDFDLVVLAMPPEASKIVTTELRSHAQWSAMLDNSHAVATQSVQMWFDSDETELGWTHGPTVATTYADPLNSWATMDQLLAAETTEKENTPQACVYFCGTYELSKGLPAPNSDDAHYVAAQTEVVEKNAHRWIGAQTTPMWPAANGASGFAWDKVLEIYNRANVAYSEQYVLTIPGTVQHRLAPGKSGFDNLYLAGDWTLTSINGGCAEGAFESGMQAACAITGQPPPVPAF